MEQDKRPLGDPKLLEELAEKARVLCKLGGAGEAFEVSESIGTCLGCKEEKDLREKYCFDCSSKYRNTGTVAERVIEECSELIKAVCKGLRNGLYNHNPATPHITNRDTILKEASDVQRVLSELWGMIAVLDKEERQRQKENEGK